MVAKPSGKGGQQAAGGRSTRCLYPRCQQPTPQAPSLTSVLRQPVHGQRVQAGLSREAAAARRRRAARVGGRGRQAARQRRPAGQAAWIARQGGRAGAGGPWPRRGAGLHLYSACCEGRAGRAAGGSCLASIRHPRRSGGWCGQGEPARLRAGARQARPWPCSSECVGWRVPGAPGPSLMELWV